MVPRGLRRMARRARRETGIRHRVSNGPSISPVRGAQCRMIQTLQALAGISIVVGISLMLIFWTKMGRFAEPVVNAIKKERNLKRRRKEMS
jgi:hypothetical protein